jgi:hypothetical protein
LPPEPEEEEKIMKNVGTTERTARIVAGVALIALGLFALEPGWGRWSLYILGLVGLGTGMASY